MPRVAYPTFSFIVRPSFAIQEKRGYVTCTPRYRDAISSNVYFRVADGKPAEEKKATTFS